MLEKSKVKELSLFLNLTTKEIIEMDNAVQNLPGFAKWINITIDNWNISHINQTKRRQVESWFNNNDKLLFELCDVHSQKTKKIIIHTALKICHKNKVKTLLDYGAGIGEEAIFASESGIKTTIADLPSLTLEFAKWRSKQRKLKINSITLTSDTSIKNKYDAIFCFEVLQHILNPQIIASYLIKHLKPKGFLFITTHFNNPNYPVALKENAKLEEGMVTFFTANKLTLLHKLYQYGDKEKSKYLFVYQKLAE